MSKVIIVTGASRGIGKAIVDQIFKESDSVRVVGVARSEGPLKEIQQQYTEERFQFVTGDIVQISQKIIDFTIEKFGRIDSIVCNAGVLDPVSAFQKADVSQWKKLYDINFFSVVDLIAKASEHLIKTNGSAIFVSSCASIMPFDAWGAYGSSKAAMNHFAMTIAAEEPAMRAISIAPGVVDTQMQVEIRENFGPKSMSEKAHKMFNELKSNNVLVPPEEPACVYAKLAVNGIPDELNGKYFRYTAQELEPYWLK